MFVKIKKVKKKKKKKTLWSLVDLFVRWQSALSFCVGEIFVNFSLPTFALQQVSH